MSAEVTQILTRITRIGPSSPTYTGADTYDQIFFTLVTDSPIYVPGASLYAGPYYAEAPKLTLSNGTFARYSGVDAQGRLEFSYFVGENQEAADLTVTGFDAASVMPIPKNIYFDQTQLIARYYSMNDSAIIRDENGDGRADVVVFDWSERTGTAYLSDGNGGFEPSPVPYEQYFGSPGAESITFDINNDGINDKVVSKTVIEKFSGKVVQQYYRSFIEVMQGRSDGTFDDARIFKVESKIYGLTAADIDGDGLLDLVTASAEYYGTDRFINNQISYLRNGSVGDQIQFDGASVATAVGAQTGIRIDMTAPVVSGVTAGGPGIVNGTGTLITGQTATITLTMSEAVSVTNAGQLVLSLNDGGQATYDAAASTATQLVFRHTVAIDQATSDLAVTDIVLNGAAIRDLAGNEAVLSRAVANPAGTLQIDGFIGTAGNDVFQGRGGAETFRGLAGDDTYLIDSSQDVVVEAVGQGFDTVITTQSFTLGDGQEIEVLQAKQTSAMGGVALIGNAFSQTIVGGYYNDTLVGGGGTDVMRGGTGDDTYSVDDSTDQVIEAVGGGNDRVFATTTYRLAAGQEIEALQLFVSTGMAKLDLSGNEFGQTLIGNAGANQIDGGGGADQLVGNKGDDTYLVDQAGDRVVEAVGGGNDRVFATTSYSLAAGQEIEALQLLVSTGTGKLNLNGNEFGQLLVGNAGANIINGGDGADTMVGNRGDDTYVVDNGRDVVREAVGGGFDSILSSVSYRIAAGVEVESAQFLIATGQLNLDLTGNEFGQALTGNAGANVLDGRGGADVLTGKAGQDAFVFSTALGAGNIDRITDFAPVDDQIRLLEDVFSAIDAGPLAASAFKNLDKAAIDADDRILYRQTTGELFYDADGSGRGAAVKFAVLDNHAKLTHDDFFVI